MDPEKKEPDPNETIFGDIDLKKESRHRIFRARLLLFCISGIALYGVFRSLPYFELFSLFPTGWQRQLQNCCTSACAKSSGGM